jgi:hypothetical protein
MENGSIVEYLKKYPTHNRLGLVGQFAFAFAAAANDSRQFIKLSEVTEGIAYLNSRKVVHGDLKGVRRQFTNSGQF